MDKLQFILDMLRGKDAGTPKQMPGRYVGGKGKDMPRRLRDYQLHTQEASLGLEPKRSYAEWSQDQE